MEADELSTENKDIDSNDLGNNYKAGPASRKKDKPEKDSNNNESDEQGLHNRFLVKSNEEEFNFLDELSFACNNFDTDSPKHRKIGADAGMVAEDSGNDEPRSSPKSSPKSTKSEEPSTPQQGQDGNEKSTANKPGPASKRGHLVDSEASTEVEDDQGYKSAKKETAIKTKKETKIEVKDVSGILKGLDEEDHEVTDVSTDTDDKSKPLKDKDIDRPKQSIKKDIKKDIKKKNKTSDEDSDSDDKSKSIKDKDIDLPKESIKKATKKKNLSSDSETSDSSDDSAIDNKASKKKVLKKKNKSSEDDTDSDSAIENKDGKKKVLKKKNKSSEDDSDSEQNESSDDSAIENSANKKKVKNWLKETNETSAKIRPGPMSKKMQAKPWLTAKTWNDWIFEVTYSKIYEIISDKNWVFDMIEWQKKLNSPGLKSSRTGNNDGEIVIQEMENNEVTNEFEVILEKCQPEKMKVDETNFDDENEEEIVTVESSPIRLSDFCGTSPEGKNADSSPNLPKNLAVARSPKGEDDKSDEQRRCCYCKAMFTRLRHLRNHVFLNHVKKQIDGHVIPYTWTSPYDCPKCNETFQERIRILKHYAFEHHCTAEDLDGKVVGRDKSFKKKLKRESSPEPEVVDHKYKKNEKRKLKKVSDSEDDKYSRKQKDEKKEKDKRKLRKEKKYVPNKEWRNGRKKKGASDTEEFTADSDEIQKTDVSEEYISFDDTETKAAKREYKKKRWGKKTVINKKTGLVDIDALAEEEALEVESSDDDEEKYFNMFLGGGGGKKKKKKRRYDSSDDEPRRPRGRPKRRMSDDEKPQFSQQPPVSDSSESDPPVSARYKEEQKDKKRRRKRRASSEDYAPQHSASEDEDDPPPKVSRSEWRQEKESLISRTHKRGKFGWRGKEENWWARYEKRMAKRQENMNRKRRKGIPDEPEWKRLERRRKKQTFSSSDDSSDSDKSSSEQAASDDSLNEFVVDKGSDVSSSGSDSDEGPPVSKRYKDSKKDKAWSKKEYHDYISDQPDSTPTSYNRKRPSFRNQSPKRYSRRNRMDTNFMQL